MMNLLSILLWVPSLALKFALAFLGLVLVPFTDSYSNPIYGNREHPEPPQWYRIDQPDWWRDYVWRAIRNPVNNLRYFIKEPMWIDDVGDNPDQNVRFRYMKSDSRWVRSGIFSEYWYMRRVGDDKFFEFRIGWKFSGVPGFAPTLQLGVRSR